MAALPSQVGETLSPQGLEPSWVPLVMILALASWVEGAFLAHLTAFTPLYLEEVGVRADAVPLWTGILVALSALVGIPFLPLWGALADRHSRKSMLVRAFAVLAGSAVLMLIAADAWTLAVGRVAITFAQGTTGLMLATLTELVPGSRVAFASTLVNGSMLLGILLGPLAGGLVVETRGIPFLLAVDFALLAAAGLLLAFGYRDRHVPVRGEPLLSMAWSSLRQVAGPSRALIVALAFAFSGWIAAYTYVPIVVADLHGSGNPARAIGWVLGLSGLATIVIAPAIGALADRWGHWRLLLAGAIAQIALLGVCGLAGSLAVFACLWAIATGAASGAYSLSLVVLANSVEAPIRGRVMTYSYLPVIIGTALGPGIASAFVGRGVWVVFPLAAGLTVVGLVALVAVSRSRPELEPSLSDG